MGGIRRLPRGKVRRCYAGQTQGDWHRRDCHGGRALLCDGPRHTLGTHERAFNLLVKGEVSAFRIL